MSLITVREFARLRLDPGPRSLDDATISPGTFDWLVDQALGTAPAAGRLVRLETPRALRLGGYVGVLEAPNGEQIEILPKATEAETSVTEARRLLLKMLSRSLGLTPRRLQDASVEAVDGPLTEWLAHGFLTRTADLVRRGMRQTYRRVEAVEPTLRGRLHLRRQLHARPGGAARFHVEHDVFTFDRPENRLIRLAVDRVLGSTRARRNWSLARELSLLLAEIPPSNHVEADLRAWRGADRLLAHYGAVRPWCELIVNRQAPFATWGSARGISLIFPMEKVFEGYVGSLLRAVLPAGTDLKAQVQTKHLAAWADRGWFSLRPDFLLEREGRRWVLDAKWKLLHGGAEANYGLGERDIYQMLAYGQAYLGGAGDMYLLYPQTSAFCAPLGPFQVSRDLRVTALPVDLQRDQVTQPTIDPL